MPGSAMAFDSGDNFFKNIQTQYQDKKGGLELVDDY
jgi:hypothetical protein